MGFYDFFFFLVANPTCSVIDVFFLSLYFPRVKTEGRNQYIYVYIP